MSDGADAAARERVSFHIAVVETVHGEKRSRVLCGTEGAEFLINVKYAATLPNEVFCPECKAKMENLDDRPSVSD